MDKELSRLYEIYGDDPRVVASLPDDVLKREQKRLLAATPKDDLEVYSKPLDTHVPARVPVDSEGRELFS